MVADVETPVNTAGVAHEWREYAPLLADWADGLLVNRRDAWGAYTPPARRGQPGQNGKDIPKNYTAKAANRGLLGRAVLLRHFMGKAHEHVIGLHSTAPDNTCRWGAFDIDRHDDTLTPTETAGRAVVLYGALRERGFRPLLYTSDERGGYHLRVILSAPAPSKDVYHLLYQIKAAHRLYTVEQFPKQAGLTNGAKYGNWLRLPGLHHTRPVWPSVYDDLLDEWVEGRYAAWCLLSYTGDDPALVPKAPEVKPARRLVLKTTADAASPLHHRIEPYLRKCPNSGAGTGRDCVGFRIACFLVHDLGLSDAEALPWLNAWDSGNSPPKGKDRWAVVLENARKYGGKP